MASQGRFIVLEGPNGCGKSTIGPLLAQRLVTATGRHVHYIESPFGERIPGPVFADDGSKPCNSVEIQLAHVAARRAKGQWIKQVLEMGDWVVCSRWRPSMEVYSTKWHDANDDFSPPDEMRYALGELIRLETQFEADGLLPRPDSILFLQTMADKLYRRVPAKYKNSLHYAQNIALGYLHVMDRQRALTRYSDSVHWVKCDHFGPDEIAEEMSRKLAEQFVVVL